MEDVDTQRTISGAAPKITEDLKWMGLDFDASHDRGGPHAPYVQSLCSGYYREALHMLHTAGRIFPCRVSRKVLRSMAPAVSGEKEGPPYPAHLRPKNLPKNWFEHTENAAIRFLVPEGEIAFQDRLYGAQQQDVAKTVGDFVLRRRDGLFSYQLAVVVDDLRMGITEVVRGKDLLSSTARQILLVHALGGKSPAYGHVPLVVNAEGKKLSKRDQGLTVASLRESGVSPRVLVGYLAFSLGLLPYPQPQRPHDLVAHFAWPRITHKRVWQLPHDLAASLRSVHRHATRV